MECRTFKSHTMDNIRIRKLCDVRTPRSPIQETAISVLLVPGMRFLVFDFAVYRGPVCCYAYMCSTPKIAYPHSHTPALCRGTK
eukprot:2327373-Rhodomonas_salina.2